MLRKKNRLNNLGFSLLEVIVALAIMGIAFITVLQLFSEGIRTLDFTDQYLKGITLANNKISELELSDFNVDVFSGDFASEEKYRWELSILPYESPLNSELNRIFLMQVNLKVLWNDMGRERRVELVTLKTLGKSYSAADLVIAGVSKQGRIGANQTAPLNPPSGIATQPGSSNTSGSQSISGAGTANISGSR